MALLAACHHHDEEHHHHDAASYTAYSDDYELFAEAEPLIVGEVSNMTCHLTRLCDFKPLDSASVTLHLSVGNNKQSYSLEAPQQPGIYRFQLSPNKAGCASILLEIDTGDSVALISYPHIHIFASHEEMHDTDEDDDHHHEDTDHHEDADEHAHSKDADHHHDHNHADHHHDHAASHAHSHAASHNSQPGAITFTKEQSWKIDFATEVVLPTYFGSVVKAAAQVLPSQGDEREAPAKASGIVVFANNNLVEGAHVSAGQRLFSIVSNGLADNNMSVKYQEAAANYNSAKADYDRKQKLAQDKIVTLQELERSRAAYTAAKAVYDNLKGNFSQSGAAVVAPISGYVKQIAVRNGAFVSAGQPVVTIAQNRDFFLRAEVQPRYYEALRHIVSTNIELPNNGGTFSLDELGGALVSVGMNTDALNPLIPVTFRLPNTLNLLSGSFVTLYMRSTSDAQVLTLPNTGIVEELGNFFVFVQITPESFEKRHVTLGGTDGIRTIITSGLKAGERVVSKGAVMVKLAQNAGALDPHAGHVH